VVVPSGSLELFIAATGERNVYNLIGKGGEPVAEGHLVIECQVEAAGGWFKEMQPHCRHLASLKEALGSSWVSQMHPGFTYGNAFSVLPLELLFLSAMVPRCHCLP